MGHNGRSSRMYGERGGRIFVTYHRNVRGRMRQLTISPKLMRKVLR